MSVQGDNGDCIKRKGNNKLEATSTLVLLLLWHSCWYYWWIAGSRRWLHLRTSLPRTWNSSSAYLSLMHNSPSTADDDDAKVVGHPSHQTLPGLIAESMSKGQRMTYEELCDAVLRGIDALMR